MSTVLAVRGLPVGRADEGQGLDLDLAAGEAVVVTAVGTVDLSFLADVLAGLQLPAAGEVIWNGTSSRAIESAAGSSKGYRLERQVRIQVGFLSTTATLIQNRSLFDNVALPLVYHFDLPEDDVAARVDRLMGMLHLTDVATRRPAGMPVGVRRRTELARALILEPPILIMESPFTGVDHESEEIMASAIQRCLRETALGALALTYQPVNLLPLARRVLVLEGARMAGILEGDDLLDHNLFADRDRLMKRLSDKENARCAPPSAA